MMISDKFLSRLPLKIKLAAFTVSLIIAVVSVLTGAIVFYSVNKLKAELNHNLVSNLRQSGETFRRFLKEIRIRQEMWNSQPIVRIFFTSPALSAISLSGLSAFFKKVRYEEPCITDILLLDHGKILYQDSGTLLSEMRNFLDSSQVSETSELFTAINLKQPNSETSELLTETPVFIISHQFSADDTPQPGKMILLVIDLKQLNEKLFSSYEVAYNGFITIAACSEKEKILIPKYHADTREMKDYIQTAGEWQQPSDIPAKYGSIILNYHIISESPAIIIGVASLDNIQKPVLHLIYISVLIGLLVSFAGIAVTLIFSRKITAPLSELTEKARAFASVHLEKAESSHEYDTQLCAPDDKSLLCKSDEHGKEPLIPVYDEQKDEIEILTKTFDIMFAEIREYTSLLEEKVIQRTEQLHKTLEKVEYANTQIMESIQYAQRIQKSLLPNIKYIQERLPDSFFLWMPREIVGGDIFITELREDIFLIALLDCTGHGVPGAFMTMLASSGLKQIIADKAELKPGKILQRMNVNIKEILQQDTENAFSDDGLDAAVCLVNLKEQILNFAGAKLPLYISQNREITVVKGDKQSIGYKRSDIHFEFTDHIIKIEPEMRFYMATDGFADQAGGEKGFPFGSRRFVNLLQEHAEKPFETQKAVLLQIFDEYRGDYDHRDDVTVIGFGISGLKPLVNETANTLRVLRQIRS